MITELRRYRIKPDRLDSWLAFFAEAAAENEGMPPRREPRRPRRSSARLRRVRHVAR